MNVSSPNRNGFQGLVIPVALALLLILFTRVAPAAAWEGDGRINLAGYLGGDSVYCVDASMNPVSSPDGAGLRLLNLHGDELFHVSPEQIAAVAHNPAVNTVIAQGMGSYGPVYLSRLTDGRFQLTGLDDHSKPYVFEWSGCTQVTPIPQSSDSSSSPSFAAQLFGACMSYVGASDADTAFRCHQIVWIIEPLCKLDDFDAKDCVAAYVVL